MASAPDDADEYLPMDVGKTTVEDEAEAILERQEKRNRELLEQVDLKK